ncbi:MAG: UDP-N-acetylglucosamine--N-acetylmuramyl-(pentapeptide) pyrophosphoryl-undecaprenol N-acetylglucosamine transferase [Phycisphaerales bacterium]
MSELRGTVLFAGGGTGGHLFPSLAVAERLAGKCEVHFACSGKPLDAEILTQAGVRFTPLPAVGLTGNPMQWFGFVKRYKQSEAIARRIIEEYSVGVVVSMGGYVSAPVIGAAAKMKLPGVLVNLDAVAGKANRRMAKKADRVFSVFDKPGLGVSFARIGFPLRRAATPGSGAGTPGGMEESRRRLGLEPATPTLLITGASQGAQTLNKLMIELAHQPLWNGWQILHLAGEGNTEGLIHAYRQHGLKAKVLPFLDEMGLAWGAADVAISRCGAGSAAEVLANGVPTIFLPYPYHKDQHQRHNVRRMEAAGGCVILTDLIEPCANAAAVEPVLAELMADADRRKQMRDALAKLQQPNGAEQLAEAVMEILGGISKHQ